MSLSKIEVLIEELRKLRESCESFDQKLLAKIFGLVVEYAKGSLGMEREPWVILKALLEDLGNNVVGKWKTTEFSSYQYNQETLDDVTLPAHFTNQLRRIPEEQPCNIQRVLQVAFNLGRAIQHKLLLETLTLDYFVELF